MKFFHKVTTEAENKFNLEPQTECVCTVVSKKGIVDM
jgi:hypothetical protein